jgi:hypothetical protein
MIISSVTTSLSTPRRPDSTVLVPTRVHVESPAVSCTVVFKKCWTDTIKIMTDITTEIKKTNEDAESIQKRKSTRRKKVRVCYSCL